MISTKSKSSHRSDSWLKMVPKALIVKAYSALRKRSFLTLGTRVEDSFAQLEKISYPILNIETVFVPHHLSVKWFSTPIQKSLYIKHRSMEKYQVVSGDFHTVQVIHHFQVSVNFS